MKHISFLPLSIKILLIMTIIYISHSVGKDQKNNKCSYNTIEKANTNKTLPNKTLEKNTASSSAEK